MQSNHKLRRYNFWARVSLVAHLWNVVSWFKQSSSSNDDACCKEMVQSGYRYAVSLTHNHHDAEDLAQQAWYKLQRNGDESIVRGRFFTTIRNLFIDSIRRKKIVEFEVLPDEEVLVDKSSEEPGIAGDLDFMLGRLKATERELLFLHCAEGYTAEEIAKLTERPRGTILSSISRAKAKLRKLAAKEASPPSESGEEKAFS